MFQVHLSAIEAIAYVLTKESCPLKLRDDLFLPKLHDFVQKSSSVEINESILKSIYAPLCCFNHPQELDEDESGNWTSLSVNSVKLHVAPALGKMAASSPKLENAALSLISKLEAIHGTSFIYASSSLSTPTLSTSTSMDEMKQKVMGKLFQSGQPFWKK